MFKQCNSRAVWTSFYLKILKTGRGLFAWRYAANTLRSGKIILSMLLLTSTLLAEMTSLTFEFVSWCHFVQRYSMYEIRLFCWLSAVFAAILDWDQVKCKNSDHLFLIHCINICRVHRKISACCHVFRQFPRDPANVNAWKKHWGSL